MVLLGRDGVALAGDGAMAMIGAARLYADTLFNWHDIGNRADPWRGTVTPPTPRQS